jgi:signal transduction histidine kinase
MLNLRNKPIKTKLIAMMMITASIGIVFMATAIIIYEAMTNRETISSELSTLAEVIGSRSTGSLTFNDPSTALENLTALKVNKNIIYAVILDEQQQMFAEYQADSEIESNATDKYPWTMHFLQKLSMGALTETIEISKAILLEDQAIGTIRIISNMNAFYTNLLNYLAWVGIVALSCFGISFAVSSRLHKLISDPVLALDQATHTVSSKNDYSIRIAGNRSDELGKLIDSFNTMLEQIQTRDKQLAGYSHQLKVQVEERTGELLQANERRIQWLENMAKFLKHELKNATVGIKSSLELIERRSQQPAIDVYIGRARKSLDFMRVLLDSVSNASSLEASVYKESLQPVDLTRLVKSEIEEYQSFYPQYTFVDDCDADIHVLGNEDRIKQLLDKLVNNAFEHCMPNSPINVSTRTLGNNAELSVTNEGVKLPDDKARIFDLFVSLRDAEHWKNDSLGLGLYIVKLIAESHGGTVIAKDREDKQGAIFTVTIPLLQST